MQHIEFRSSPNAQTFDDINNSVVYNAPLFFGTYQQNNFLTLSAVFAALDIISSSIALMPITVRQRAEGKDTIIDSHLVPQLFDTTLQSRFTLIKTLIWDIFWRGNAFMYIKRDKAGLPLKLIYLEPGDVSIDYNKSKNTVTYNVTNHGDIPTKVPSKDIIHLLKNTRDGVTGIGILAYATPAFRLSDYLNSSAEDFFGSGQCVTSILKFKGMVSDKSKQDIRTQWQQVHGSGNPGAGLVVVGGDADFMPVSSDPSKSQMLESRKFAIEEIARFFGINPLLLGDLAAGNWSAIEEINISFVQYTLLPIVAILETEFTRKLLITPGQWVDLDETVLLKANKQNQMNYITGLVKGGIISINEGRRMLGYNPVDGGDDLLIPYTDISQNTVNEQQTENQPVRRRSKKKK